MVGGASGKQANTGMLSVADGFRIGRVGAAEAEIDGVLAAVRAVLAEMGVESGAPAAIR